MEITSIVNAAQTYVTQQFQANPSPALTYHNLLHTQQVVDAASKMVAYYRLTEEQMMIVMVAAWFHDIGYVIGVPAEHESVGAAEAKKFMLAQNVSETLADQVAGCILATRIPQSPNNLLEQIVCDADLSHFGSKDFKERNKLLHKEIELRTGKEIPGIQWTQGSITFLESTSFHTAYAQTLYRQQKEENLQKLKSRLHKKEAEQIEEAQRAEKKAKVAAVEEVKDKKKEEKEKKPERGIETMFRTTSTNHIRLSSMADSKANIMITVNSLIISLMLSILFRRLEDNPNLTIPTMIFLVSSVVTIIFAVLATRPNITSGRFTKDDIMKKQANLLFFGNFHQMSFDEYEEGMEMIMSKGEYLYSNMTLDVYHLGVVLGRKYKLLRISYNTFMFGIIISVIAFVVAILFFPNNPQ
ncbi:putative metal-dependent HD superfamily phosphohydrolase [Chitinophaga skermanii]|uniref:Putative metal-dependent HD superfamily phosphohydrolase n=1 Tax=Chitinophaga skermanii TaxID=331697 RepID=A0A327QJ38_9BACT|nr:Pycsar system effector family protein [Chitinophaga skermanii]RAJ04281.1 putative metal-dependent HD superfamily phosphohydrolase [Chitinophaga skermanii]